MIDLGFLNVIAFSRKIGPVGIACVLSEKHTSEVEITSNPIETGAEVADHAFVKPKQVIMEVADTNASSVFNDLVRFQSEREPFTLVTGLTVYSNMLIQAIDTTRDKVNAAVLQATVTLREVIIVSTGSAPAEAGPQPTGAAGGANSTSAAIPTPETVAAGGTSAAAGSSANASTGTADRAATTVQTGDNPVEAVPEANTGSLLSRIF